METLRDFPSGFSPRHANVGPNVVSGKRDFPAGCGPRFSGQKRRAAEMESDPDTFKWWRNVSAVKTKPLKKNPLPVIKKMKPRDEEETKVVKKVVSFAERDGGDDRRRERGVEMVVRPRMGKERERVLEVLRLFRKRCDEISKNERHVKRVDNKAFTELKREGKIVKFTELSIGHVAGVEIGDKFLYRIELVIVGLHRHTQGGIDTKEFGWKGEKVATCIVANEGYVDKMSDPNVLTYIGEGGVLQRYEAGGVPGDQKLEGGNRALYNSMIQKKPVRVVRGLKMGSYARGLYVYDGLYEVKECVKRVMKKGNVVFEFSMSRCPGQPPVNWVQYRLSR